MRLGMDPTKAGITGIDTVGARYNRTAPGMTRERPTRATPFFFSSRRRHTRWTGDWSSDVCSSDLKWRERRICPQTRDRVLATAKRMGYVPHHAARRLARARCDARQTSFDQVGLI